MTHTPVDATKNINIQSRILAELAVLARFGLVGISATAVHVSVVWILLYTTALPPLLANTAAFACAFGVSFTGNYLWTFGAPGSPKTAMLRFLMISIIAFTLNSSLFCVILRFGWLDPVYAATGSAMIIPVITFFASRLWGFNYSKSPSR